MVNRAPNAKASPSLASVKAQEPRHTRSSDTTGRFAHDSLFWRRLARFGAAHGPEWWVRYTPAAFGLAAAVAVPTARRAIQANLRRIRGSATPLRDAVDVARTFTTYAGCLAEVLSNGSKNAQAPDLVVDGAGHMAAAMAHKKGIILVTAHTAGWEIVGPVLGDHHHVSVVLVMAAERNRDAGKIHDAARHAAGLDVAHVGDDPLASLPLLQHLRRGSVLALQIDRVPRSMRGRRVRLFDKDGEVPEGPIRLAQASGAPIVPAFCARLGYRSYIAEISPPIRVSRDAAASALDAVAQQMADAMTGFVRKHPTQWFDFGPR